MATASTNKTKATLEQEVADLQSELSKLRTEQDDRAVKPKLTTLKLSDTDDADEQVQRFAAWSFGVSRSWTRRSNQGCSEEIFCLDLFDYVETKLQTILTHLSKTPEGFPKTIKEFLDLVTKSFRLKACISDMC